MTREKKRDRGKAGVQVHFKVILTVTHTLPVVPNSSNLTIFQEQLGPHLHQEVFGTCFRSKFIHTHTHLLWE